MSQPMPSDLEIARAVRPRPILDIAHELGLRDDEVELYGPTKAKVRLEAIERLAAEATAAGRWGKYVVITAITPTPLGEGKTTTVVGLVQGLNRVGHRAAVCIRQPSLGTRVRDQGRGGRRRLLAGHPDGGLQPPPDRRRPRRRARPTTWRPPSSTTPSPTATRSASTRLTHHLAAGRGHQRPRCAPRRHRPRRQGERLSPRDGMADHGGLGGHGGPRPRREPAGPSSAPRA